MASSYIHGPLVTPNTITDMIKNVTPKQLETLMRRNMSLWSAYSGILVDDKPFSFEGRRYLIPIYNEPVENELVLLKSAQSGASIYMLLKLLYLARNYQMKVGLYLPNAELVKTMSKDRFGPIIESNKELNSNVSDDANSLSLKKIRNIHGGNSSLYLLYLGGVSSKDSIPLDAAFFDEVRLVKQEDIEQALQRLNGSKYRYKTFMSTSGSSSTNIHRRFMQGTQSWFMTRCGCESWVCLAETFPDCVVQHRGETYYRCPRCKYRIYDPQNGAYIARNPEASYSSYQVSALVANVLTPKEIWDKYVTSLNKNDFHNSILGLPYVDSENIPITDEVLERCINNNLQWVSKGTAASHRGKGYVMGVDQMQGYSYVVIGKQSTTDGGFADIVHYEIIEDGNPIYGSVSPFRRIHQLMTEYDIKMAVVDAQPGFGEAADLARAFPGRVFLAYYTYGGNDMVRWQDRPKEKATIRKGGKDIKLPWQVVIQRYQAIDYVTQLVQEGAIKFPKADGLVPTVRSEKTGRFEPENIVTTRFFKHLKSIERTREYDPDKGTEKVVWKEHIDPHSLHALVYAVIALGRSKRSASLISFN